jgi:drug/metabolite transporter (DMT)-like permease
VPPERLLPVLALSLSTAVWGSSFFLSKGIVDDHDPLTLIALRFGIGAVLMLAVRPQCLRGLSRSFWLRAVVCGGVYAAAQVPHYSGLRYVPASTAGFLVGVYVVLTPVLDFLLFRRRATPRTIAGVTLAGVGLAVLAWAGAGSPAGFVLCLLAAAVYALQISALGAWSPSHDTWAFTLLQLGTCAVIVGTAAAVKGVDPPTSSEDWWVILYLAVVVGVVGIGVQTWAQSRIPASHAAVVMAGEPLWAAVLAVALTAETLTTRLLVGGALLLGANIAIATSRERRI